MPVNSKRVLLIQQLDAPRPRLSDHAEGAITDIPGWRRAVAFGLRAARSAEYTALAPALRAMGVGLDCDHETRAGRPSDSAAAISSRRNTFRC